MAILSEEVPAANPTDTPPRKKLRLSLSASQCLRQTTLSTTPVNNLSGDNMSVTLNASKNGHEGRSEYSQNDSRARHDRRTDYLSSRSVHGRDFQSSRLDSRSSGWSSRNETSGTSAADSYVEAMALGGYGIPDAHNLIHSHNMAPIGGEDSPSSDTPPVATLCNLGNTCFLNSILYTLRFAPSFLHNLHHLVRDLGDLNLKHQQCKAKSSSLGRNVSSSGRPWSNKDTFSLGGNSLHSSSSASDPALGKSRIQTASEKLHELYEAMHRAEQLKDSSDPFQPDVFLHALRDVNPIFEGNQQHDAHELLGCLLNIIRDTCLQLIKQVKSQAEIPNGIAKPEEIRKEKEPVSKSSILSLSLPTKNVLRKSWKQSKKAGIGRVTKSETSSVIEQVKSSDGSFNGSISSGNGDPVLNSPLSDKKSLANGESSDHASTESLNGSKKINGSSLATLHEGEETRSGLNFIADDFEGVSILQTTCLECECVTEMKEAFCEIGVPIPPSEDTDPDKLQGDVSNLYKSSVVTEELLHNGNKYWCEHCSRYNEARRSVRYERLPRLLTLQLKRFSSTFGSMVCMSKVNEYMPTPLSLDCFCQQCCRVPENPDGSGEPHKKHTYQLYSVIMHLGATMASGHYVAYVRASDPTTDYSNCDRDKRKTASLVSTSKSTVTQNGDKPRRIIGRLLKGKSKASESSPKNPMSILHYYGNTCRSLDCCGVRVNRSVMVNDSSSGEKSESVWLECDDETIRVLTRRQFEEVLAPKQAKTSALTPYLLFYVRDP